MSSSAQQRVKDECEKDLGFLAQEKSNLAEKRSQCQKAFDAQMDLLKKEEGHLASLESKLQEKLKISSAPSEPKNGGYGESEDTGKGPNGQRKSNFYSDDQQWDQPNEASSWDQGNDNSSWDQKPGQQWGDVNEESGQNGQGNQSNGGDDYGYLTKKQREKRTTKKGDDWSNANEWGHGGETQEQSGNDWGNGGGEAQEQSGRDRGNGGQRGGSHWPGQTEDYYANPNPRKKYNNNFYDKSKKAKNTQWGNDQSMYDEPPVAVDMGFENPQSGNSGGGGDAWGYAPQEGNAAAGGGGDSWAYNPTESNRDTGGGGDSWDYNPTESNRDTGGGGDSWTYNPTESNRDTGGGGDSWTYNPTESNRDTGGGGDSLGHNPQGAESGGFANQDYNGGQAQAYHSYEEPQNAIDREEYKTVTLKGSEKALDGIDYDTMNGIIFRTERSPGQLYVFFVDGTDAQSLTEQEMTVEGESIAMSLRPTLTLISRKHKAAIEAGGRRAIRISGLPQSTSDAALKKTCGIFGPVHTFKAVKDNANGMTALVVYSDLLHGFRALPVLKERPEFVNCEVQHSDTYALTMSGEQEY